jgi:hypothetical protein
MKTVTVIEGFSGGPKKTRRFKQALAAAGFKIVNNRHQADVIVAHSAGIYAVPVNADAKLLMLIGPNYWPEKPLLKRMRGHMKAATKNQISNYGWRFYFWTKILEFYYFFTRNKYMWLGIIHNNKLDHINKLISKHGRKTLIIRNREDSYTSSQVLKEINHRQVTLIELPGIHDDYYTNPKPYIDLLLRELK